MSIRKNENSFEYRPVTEFIVNVDKNEIQENLLEKDFSPRAVHETSAAFEASAPGTYAPKS